jgi:peptidoglycan/LPS O-acetylase OafA/YrhL
VGLVLLYHSVISGPVPDRFYPLVAGSRLGWSGVDLFFVLSGFLIGGILLDVRHSPNYFKTFYLRRAYRILPIYFVLLGFFSLRFLPLAAGRLGDVSHNAVPWYTYFLFLQNIWMAIRGNAGFSVVAPTWSLAVEEQFYLTAPLILRKLNPSAVPKTLLGVIVAVPVFRVLLYTASHNGMACHVSMPCHADALSLGILAAWLVRNRRGWDFLLRHRNKLKAIAFLFLLGTVALTPWGAPLGAPMVTAGYTWLAIFYTLVLLVVVTVADQRVNRMLRNRVLVGLGTVSYFAYLFHGLFMEATRRFMAHFGHLTGNPTTTSFVAGYVGIGFTLLAAELSWRYFEKPLVTYAHRYRY